MTQSACEFGLYSGQHETSEFSLRDNAKLILSLRSHFWTCDLFLSNYSDKNVDTTPWICSIDAVGFLKCFKVFRNFGYPFNRTRICFVPCNIQHLLSHFSYPREWFNVLSKNLCFKVNRHSISVSIINSFASFDACLPCLLCSKLLKHFPLMEYTNVYYFIWKRFWKILF